MSSRLDIIVFGATGYTGKEAVHKMVTLAKEKALSWGIAGRNLAKLESVLKEVSDKTGTDCTNVKTFVADIKDEQSLRDMTKNATALVNCCGPYRFYGEQVIKACIATKTHHVDVSGEPQFMEKMQLKYHKDAEENGVYVISACGFDSLVCEIGILHMMNSFKGQLNSIETYLETDYKGKQQQKGASIHYGTWESAIYSLVHANELRPLREQLYPKRLPNFTPKLKPRPIMHKNPEVNKWCLPFPGSDRSIALRTQRHFYDYDKKRPIQVQTYVAFKSFLHTVTVAFVGLIFGLMTKTSFTRTLLLNHPKLFSCGMVSHEGPPEDERAEVEFSMTFLGEGWSEVNSVPEEEHTQPPAKKMITKVSGMDPGYGFTCTALILSAVTVLKDASKMPGKGGVYPAGAAFANTSLMTELQSHGLKIEVLSSE